MKGGRAYVIWDLDGTLVRLKVTLLDVEEWKRRLAGRLAAYGWDRPLSPLLPSLEAALELAARELSSDDTDELRRSVYTDLDRWESDAVAGVELIEPHIRQLRKWLSAGFPTAIVSNNGPTAVHQAVELIFGPETSDRRGPPLAVVARHPDRRAKPSPDAYEAAIAELQAAGAPPPGAVAVLGDGTADWEAAHALGASAPFHTVALAAWDGRLLWPPGHSNRTPPPNALASLGLRWECGG